MLRVGLTGGIACGKSLVARRLAARGLATVDLDRVGHELMTPGRTAYEEVVSAFGPSILAGDGTIDRRALGAIVFGDGVARRRLEGIVHPKVREEEARRAAAVEASGGVALVSEAALLVEAGAHLRFDRLVVVHCTPDRQLARLAARDGLAEGAARARMAAQMSTGEKRLYAHAEIDTSGTVEDTEAATDDLAARLLELAARPRPRGSAGERWVGAAAGDGPRGLDGARLLEDAAAAGGIELERVARRLTPPSEGPWYRSARADERAPWPEALAVALAAWSVREGMDVEWLASAAASLARLTHDAASDVAAAVLAALVASEVGARLGLEVAWTLWEDWERRALRWGGAPPSPRVRDAVEAARSNPRDGRAAAEAARTTGAEPALAAGLVALLGSDPC